MVTEAEHHRKVVSYFEGSRLGYDVLLWGSKHFGFYPTARKDISEKKAQELMQDLVAENLKITSNQLVLDAGCGQGVVSTYLVRKYGCKIIGITLVPFEIDKALQLAKKMGVDKKVAYKLMDYSDATFKDNQFDAIYTMESFVHSPNAKKTLNEFFRILKPGGRLAMFEYTIAPDENFNGEEKKMLNLVIEISAMASLKNMRHSKFPEMLRQVGFGSVREQDISPHVGPSLERLRSFAVLPYFFIKLFRLQRFFINVTAAVECYDMAKKGLIRYCTFTAKKPI